MAITTVCPSEGAWDKTRVIPTSGHFATYKPSPRILTLYAPNGTKLLEQTIASGVRDFDLFVSQSGEIVVQFADFADGAADWSFKRWWTNTFVSKPAVLPPPPATNNGAVVAQMRLLLDQIV